MKPLYTREEAFRVMAQTIGLLAGLRRAGGIKKECESLLACFDREDYRTACEALSLTAANEYFRYFADIAEWAGLETREDMRNGEIVDNKDLAQNTEDNLYINARDSVKDYAVVTGFYRNLAESVKAYRAHGGGTQCNVFVHAMLREQFGETTQKKIFPNGLKLSNVMFERFKENKEYLERIDTMSMKKIQDMADRGVVILMACKNDKGPGHMAFVGHSSQVINTDIVPEAEGYLQQNKRITDLEEAWWPVVVQAGRYTGVTSARYATTGWLTNKDELLRDSIHFYAIKKEAL